MAAGGGLLQTLRSRGDPAAGQEPASRQQDQGRPSLNAKHRAMPSFSDFSLGSASDAEQAYHGPAAHSQPVPIQQPPAGRHSLEACEGIAARPLGLRRLSQVLATSPAKFSPSSAPSDGSITAPAGVPSSVGSSSSTETTPKRGTPLRVHGLDAHDWVDMMRTSSL